MARFDGDDTDNTLDDTFGNDELYGYGGNDTLRVSGGIDTAAGGTGLDTLVLAYGAFTGDIYNNGGPYEDGPGSYYGSFTGAARVDYTSIERFEITTGSGNDTITTGKGDDVVNTGAGNDVVNVGSGSDSANGGADFDVISADLSALAANISWDLRTNLSSLAFVNFEAFGTLRLGSGNDTIVSGEGANETIYGNDGNDSITVRGGLDTVFGGSGLDTLVMDYASFAADIYVNGGPYVDDEGGYYGSFTGAARVDYDSIERFDITTGGGADTISTGVGDDVVKTGAGDDVVNTGSGIDVADGGNGVDRISADLTAVTTAITWNLQTNRFNGAGARSFRNFEAFGTITTGSGNDTVVTGTGYDEVVNGGAGNDTVTVFGGSDQVRGGAGDDRLIIDYRDVTTSIYNNGGPYPDDEGGYYGTFTGAARVDYDSIEAFTVRTGSGDDLVTTGIGADALFLGAGADMANVGSGADTADGGAGRDGLSADLSALSTAVQWNLQTNTFSAAGRSFINFEYLGTLSTGAGNDVIVTGSGEANETLYAGAGDDRFTAVDGADRFFAGSGRDTLVINYAAATVAIYNNGGPYVDDEGGFWGEFAGGPRVGFDSVEDFNITTGSGADNITVASGDDVVSTGAGDDVVNVGTGVDTADGGTGRDGISADLTDAAGAILWNLVANTFSGGPDQFGNFEYFGTVTLGSGNDVIITGASLADETVFAGEGDDRLTTVDGADRFYGGAGRDTLVIDYSAAAVSIYNNGGPYGDDEGGVWGEFAGGPRIYYDSIEDFDITTGSGADNITTAAGNDTVSTGSGDDLVNVGSGLDEADGGAGMDGISADLTDSAGAVIWDLAANTFAGVTDSFSNFEYIGTLTMGGGDDVVVTAAGTRDETVYGGGGNDRFATVDGADRFFGGAGRDTLVVDYSAATAAIFNNGGPYGDDEGGVWGEFAGGPRIYYDSVEDFDITTGSGDDSIITAGGDDRVVTGIGSDTVSTGAGADLIDGGAGDDTIDGGEGTDTASFATVAGPVTVNLSLAARQNTGAGNDLLVSIENLIGTAAGDTLTGNDLANTLDGAGGADTLAGGLGDDTYVVDAAGDVVTEAADAGTDTVRAAISYVLGTTLENLVLTGAAAINGTGNSGANILTGNGAANTLDGKGGADAMAGLGGDDTYIVDDAGDTASEENGSGTDLVRTSVSFVLGDGLEDLVLTGNGRLDGTGNALANRITGNNGANRLTGAGGDDTLTGGGGSDTLTGGSGIDTAVFTGRFADYDLALAGGTYTMSDRRAAGDGVDTLATIERVTLSTGTYAIADVVNVGPSGVADTAGVVEAGRDGAGNPSAAGNVLANDTDGNLAIASLGEALAVTGARSGTGGAFTAVAGATVIQGTYGTLTIRADGTYSYALDNTRGVTDRLAPGQVVQDVFAYTLADLHGATSQAVLSVAVTGTDDTVAGADALQVTLGRASSIDAAVLLGDDSGAIGETLAVTGVSNAVGATVQLVNGRLVITATQASGGFDYTVTTSEGGTATGHVDLSAVDPKRRLTATAPAGATAVDYVGGDKADRLTGGTGADRLIGGGGNDQLDGGTGDDRMEGGAGSDRYRVDSAGDLVVEDAQPGVDTVFTTLASYTLAANVEGLVFDGAGAFVGIGNAGRNTITGGAGNDQLSGGDGVDVLIGGAGNDRLDGGGGSDTTSFAGNPGRVVVDLRIAGAQDTGAGQDTLIGIENVIGTAAADTLTGNDGANTLTGGGNRDVLIGNGGADTLIGGLGGDTMTGGAGADAFVFNALEEIAATDRITDFVRAERDVIDMSRLDADATLDGQQTFAFIGTGAFTGAGGTTYELRYQAAAGGDLQVQGDINHDGLADFTFLVRATALQASDFDLTPSAAGLPG